jgi:hypothetical protein
MLVFLHVPKTAGSTFQFILENSFGPAACHTNHAKKKFFGADDFAFAKKVFPWLCSLAGHNLLDPLCLPIQNPFYITFLREPVARVISHYQDSVLNGDNELTFEQTLRRFQEFENCHVKHLGNGNLDQAKRFLEQCHFVGLTERFELSLEILQRLSPCKLNLKYKRRRVAASNSLRTTVESDPRLIELAKEYNRLDLELYAFAKNEIFTRQCERVGLSYESQTRCRDLYRTELKPRFLLCQLYNMLVYRQLGKLRRPARRELAKAESIAAAPVEGNAR